jgi:hypothetical protein
VSRASVREALRVLEATGIIRTGVGSGPDAGAVVIDNPAAGLTAGMRMHIASPHLPVSDIIELRVLLETWAVARVAEASRAAHDSGDAAPDLGPARAVLDRMEGSDAAIEEFHRLDAEFHVGLPTGQCAGRGGDVGAARGDQRACDGRDRGAAGLVGDRAPIARRAQRGSGRGRVGATRPMRPRR